MACFSDSFHPCGVPFRTLLDAPGKVFLFVI